MDGLFAHRGWGLVGTPFVDDCLVEPLYIRVSVPLFLSIHVVHPREHICWQMEQFPEHIHQQRETRSATRKRGLRVIPWPLLFDKTDRHGLHAPLVV